MNGADALGPGEVIVFHRVRGSDEIWALVAGGPLEVHLIHADGRHEQRILSLAPSGPGASATTIPADSLRAAVLAPGGRGAILQRAAASGRHTHAGEVPSRAEILREHPLHRKVVTDLTAG